MEDTGGASGGKSTDAARAPTRDFGGSIGGRSSGGAQVPMEDLLGALALFMQQQRANQGGQEATKALKAVVAKIGRFDGKNVSKFLRTYVCEMEVQQVDEDRMMLIFDMAVVPGIRERVREIRGGAALWTIFAEQLQDEYFEEDSERMTKRSFLEWIEQQPGNNMGPNELFRDFEKKYAQLPLVERRLLDSRKAELFLQATDNVLEDRLLLLLGDRATEGGFTNDWRRVEETVILLAKQQRVRSRSVGTKIDLEPIYSPRAPKVSFAPLPSIAPASNLKVAKTNDENALEELIKGFRELRVEFTELKKSRGASSSQPSEGARKFPRRCVWCDEETEHTLRGCESYEEMLKSGHVFYKDGKIHDASTDSPLRTNFGRGGMKRLMEEQMARSSYVQVHGAETYHIQLEHQSIDVSPIQTQMTMKRGAQAIRRATGWEDPVDANSIKAFLYEEKSYDEFHEASVEEKRVRFDDEEGEEPASKRRPPVQSDPAKEMRKRVPTRSKTASPEFVHPGDDPLPDRDWGQSSSNKKGQVREDLNKAKIKGPAYKLQSDIETSIDLKGVLEERILDAKIVFTLREALGIAKKDFHELIIDIIKRKRQMTAEAVMVSALDTHMTKGEEIEIGEVFAMMGDPMAQDEEVTNLKMEETRLERVDNSKTKANTYAVKIEASEREGSKVETQTFECTYENSVKEKNDEKFEFDLPFWARATTETKVKLGGLDEPMLALVDHGSEINIISRDMYEKGKWPIDTEHGWIMRAANSGRTRLHGACPAVPTKIGNVEVEQNFFVQNSSTYPVLLGQPFITASRMETKVLDDGSHYARIRSVDGKKSVQFLTVRPDNERHRLELREVPLPTSINFPNF